MPRSRRWLSGQRAASAGKIYDQSAETGAAMMRVADGEDVRAGVQDDSGSERVASLVTEPGQMAGVGSRHSGGCFDLDPDQVAARGLDKQVYPPAALLFPQVVHARDIVDGGEFGAQLPRVPAGRHRGHVAGDHLLDVAGETQCRRAVAGIRSDGSGSSRRASSQGSRGH